MIYEELKQGSFLHHSTTAKNLHLAKKKRMIEQKRKFHVLYRII